MLFFSSSFFLHTSIYDSMVTLSFFIFKCLIVSKIIILHEKKYFFFYVNRNEKQYLEEEKNKFSEFHIVKSQHNTNWI